MRAHLESRQGDLIAAPLSFKDERRITPPNIVFWMRDEEPDRLSVRLGPMRMQVDRGGRGIKPLGAGDNQGHHPV